MAAPISGGEGLLLSGSQVLLKYDDAVGGVWEERVITGICDDPQYFTAVDTFEDHYVHDCTVIKDVAALGARGGVPAKARKGGRAITICSMTTAV